MDIDKIKGLIEVLEGSRAEELCVRKGDVSVHIRKGHAPKLKPARTKATAANALLAEESQPLDSDETYILSPMVGMFHTVDGVTNVGAQIHAGQVVGHIESMKLLNDVVSDVSGIVVEAIVDDGMPVEYGQPLYKLKPISSEGSI